MILRHMIIDKENNIKLGEKEFEETTFKELGVNENSIEELIRENPDLILPNANLLIVGQQVRNVENGISDLTAIDEHGNIILIEIKRDLTDQKKRKEPFESQAIRYAASYASISTREELVYNIYAPYINKHINENIYKDYDGLTAEEIGFRKLNELLKGETFNQKQRIILVASEFDPQTISSVTWLIENKIDIMCISIKPYKIPDNINDKEFYLKPEKVLPLTKPSENYIKIKNTYNSRINIHKSDAKNLPKIKEMMDNGWLNKGDELYLKNSDQKESIAKVIDNKFVEHKGYPMKYNEWGKSIKGWSSICIYEWAIKKDEEKTLDYIRKEKLKSLNE